MKWFEVASALGMMVCLGTALGTLFLPLYLLMNVVSA